MFIEPNANKKSPLRRSGMFLYGGNISLRRSFGRSLLSGFYKHFVPTGFPLAIVLVICIVGVINSRAYVGSTVPQSPQEKMQFPENLDYSKFQHSNRNHSRLPCLLCHRRDSNAPVPKRPGASQHLPCAGCHAQQFANAESPICTICHTDVKSGALKPFPSRLISFGMKFDHAKHVAMGNVNCSTCHR